MALLLALKQNRQPTISVENLPYLSLIVPFRNEEQHLPQLFADIELLNYPLEKLEVLLVDDHSDDKSVVMAQEWAGKARLRVKVLHLTIAEGKKAALQLGVANASHSIIVQTDADCRVGVNWLASMVSCLLEETVLVGGPVQMIQKNGFWSGFAALEYMSLQAVSAAFILKGQPIMASGANLLFRKEIWTKEAVQSERLSGDDTFLVQAAAKNGRVGFALHQAAQVSTHGVTSLRELINQRARWGGKSFAYPSLKARLLSFMIAIYNMHFLVLTALSFSEPWLVLLLLLSLSIKAAVDYPFLKLYARITDQNKLMAHFWIAIPLYPLYIALTGIVILFGKTEWKSRQFRPAVD